MDDFNIGSLHESRNEWCVKLLTILTPLVIEGYKSIFNEAYKLCKENQEEEKYLMTFQNFIQRIPKWNSVIIETERKRIIEKSGCLYLEDLVCCVHIIQLKTLTAMRVGHKQKKIDISIPKLDDFIHKVYIQTARKIYKNVYLFQIKIDPLQILKHNRELEIIVQECILNTIRDSIPVETILKAYMEETIEENITEEINEEIITEPIISVPSPEIPRLPPNLSPSSSSSQNLSPPTFSHLKQSSPDEIKLNFTDDMIDLNLIDIDMNNEITDNTPLKLLPDLLQDDIEILD
jgi:hypothetical protein